MQRTKDTAEKGGSFTPLDPPWIRHCLQSKELGMSPAYQAIPSLTEAKDDMFEMLFGRSSCSRLAFCKKKLVSSLYLRYEMVQEWHENSCLKIFLR